MPTLSTQANRFYPSLPEITQDSTTHTNALMQIKSALQTHERRDGDYLKSFVRFEELITLGIIDENGDSLLAGVIAGGSLGGLSDVTLSGIADNNILGYNIGTGQWENQTPSQLGIVEEAPTDGLDYARNNSAWVVSSGGGVTDHALLTSIGTNTHASIDLHIADASIHTPDSDIVHITGTEVIVGIKQFDNLTFFTADLTLDNSVGINWEDSTNTAVELLILDSIVPGGTPPSDPNIGSVVFLATGENSNGSILTPEIGPSLSWNGTTSAVLDGFISTVQAKYGTKSIYWKDLNGGSFAGWQPAASTTVGDFTGDFTIELDVFVVLDTTSPHELLAKWDFPDFQWRLRVTPQPVDLSHPGRVGFVVSPNGSFLQSIFSQEEFPTEIIALNEWNHLAVTRSGTNFYLFLNGELSTNSPFVYASALHVPVADHYLVMGQQGFGDGSGRNEAYSDNIRITDGVARYTAAFTPPTAPYDGSSGDAAFVVGDPAIPTLIDGLTTTIRSASVGVDGDLGVVGAASIAGVLSISSGMFLAVSNQISWKDSGAVDTPLLSLDPLGTDPDFANVSFLSSFDGVDAATTAVDKSTNAAVITFVGNAQLDTAQSKFGTASLLLDGVGDYCTVPDNAAFEFGTGDFTVECFSRFNGDPGVADMSFVGQYSPTGNQRGWTMQLANNLFRFGWTTDGTGGTFASETTVWDPVGSVWYHAAISRASGTLRMFIDGVLLKSVANVVDIFAPAAALSIGAHSDGNQPMNGWIDEVRVTKGVARYTAGFTPPTDIFPTLVGVDTFVAGISTLPTQINGSAIDLTAPVDIVGDLTLSGTVDGRGVALDGTNQDTHIADATIHFTEASIDHANILSIGVNTHAQIDTHIADGTIHFPRVSVSTTVALADITDAINTSADKVAGFLVFNSTTNAPVWAVGLADGDVWNDATGAVAHTPI